jgi:glutathione synthase/RimK-type ligase-like ATP-grasp enzyme
MYVGVATDKLDTLQCLVQHGISIPSFTQTKEVAAEFINQGEKIVCRTILTGHSGQGIIVAQTVEELVDCQLYTVLVPKDKEYRVHVFNGSVIDFAQKKAQNGSTRAPYIRSHENGWVFCREGVTLPDAIAEEAIKAVVALGLDFGAVDIATKREDNTPVVFEVNTAPGICGTTLDRYVAAIRRIL